VPGAWYNHGNALLATGRAAGAVASYDQALRLKPDMAEARTNLRLALAMGGDYERAISGASVGDRAALLNNAGFAAGMRGDYAKAEELLNEAVKVKTDYYARASENLKIVRALAAQNPSSATAHANP
jgi:tetratricopeptide (TPR) repeat protein